MNGQLSVEIISSEDQFNDLHAEWNSLLDRSFNNNLFLTWEWLNGWWSSYCFDKALCIILFRKHDELVCIFPFYSTTFKSGIIRNNKELRLLGTGEDSSPDYMSFIIFNKLDKEDIDFIYKELCGLFSKLDISRIQLFDIIDKKETNTSLKNYLNDNGAKYEEKCRYHTYKIIIPKTWDDYLHGFSDNSRRNYKRLLNKIKRDGIEIKQLTDAYIYQVFDRLVDLHSMRWEKLTDTYSFMSQNYRDFHINLMRVMAKYNALKIYVLLKNKTIIAFIYCYQYKNKMYYIQSGFDPSYHASSPGKILIYRAIREAIEAGCTEFDMLKGDHEYKKAFMNATEDCSNIAIYKNNTTYLYFKVYIFMQRLKKYTIKKILSLLP